MNIAVFARELSPNNYDKFQSLMGTINQRGVKCGFYRDFYESLPQELKSNLVLEYLYDSIPELSSNVDILLSLGGDGTLLNSLRVVQDFNVLVAGVNFGRLGFLTATKLEEKCDRFVDNLIANNFSIIERATLKVSSKEIDQSFFAYALNEISIHRNDASMLSIDLKVNGLSLPTYWSDGIIVATPTGSTAYNLSVGGPLVTPDSKVTIISPIAPHNLNVRPLIVPEGSSVEIVTHSRSGYYTLNVDNRDIRLSCEYPLTIENGDFKLKTINMSDTNFFDVINEKLLWGEDRRNSLSK